MDVVKAVNEAIQESFPLFDGKVTSETTAQEVPGWDSFGHVQLIFAIEDKLGIILDAVETLNCENVGELYTLLQEKT